MESSLVLFARETCLHGVFGAGTGTGRLRFMETGFDKEW